MPENKLGPYALNSIITGDARILAEAIPEKSIDLIFCDPLYDRIDDYRWLAEIAKRLLKPDGNCLAFTNAKWLPILLQSVPARLPVLSYQRASALCPLNGRIISKTSHLIWWGSGKIVGYMPDGYLSTNWSKNYQDPGGHRWNTLQ